MKHNKVKLFEKFSEKSQMYCFNYSGFSPKTILMMRWKRQRTSQQVDFLFTSLKS